MSADMVKKKSASVPTLNEIEQQTLSVELNGSQGLNREQHRRCLIRATNDFEAIHCWLNEYKDKLTTYESYRKEAERLILWCVLRHKKALSSLDTDDFKSYFEFLDNPQPASFWCGQSGGRSQRRGSSTWKPFTGPLSHASKSTAISIIHSLIAYLVDANYLSFNPITIIRKRNARRGHPEERKHEVKKRILDSDEWYAILDTLEEMPESRPHELDEKMRLKFIIHMLFFLGLRISELTSHCWNAFRCEDGRWWFYVVGKGDKLGKIPVNDSLMETVKEYRQHLQFSSDIPQQNEDIPLVTSWKSDNALTARAINHKLKALALSASQKFSDKPEKAEKITKFSAHWLRHLSASMQDRMGVSFKHIRENHRHTKDDTTRLYIHADDIERHGDANKLKLYLDDL